jgi:alpha-galactosidase
MKKIAFIGAGSFGFTRSLVRDILSFPAFNDCTIALMDIDDERLSYIKRAVDKIVAAGNYPAKVIATKDRAEALKDADGVVCTILAGEYMYGAMTLRYQRNMVLTLMWETLEDRQEYSEH